VLPTDDFEHESGFPVRTAERAQFAFEEAHRRRLKNAVIDNIETNGWSIIQTVVDDVAFPVTQSVEIAAGDPGSGSFSIQLLGKMLNQVLTVGLASDGTNDYTPIVFCSNDSFEEHFNWGIATQFDTSTPAQISEDLKSRLSQMSGVANVGSYRNIPIIGLRRLGTGDVDAGKDFVYLVLKSSLPNGLVLPVRLSRVTDRQTGMEELFPLEMSNSPTSVYDFNEVRTKVRWQAGYACLDARTLYVGIVDRT
jgi:hypothetical protein